MNDWELIQNYCRNGSESAFETLVKRHVDYVYCAALRQVRDPSLAEDVSQAVFLLLAQKAKSFRPDTVVVSWLFRTTHFIAVRALRSEHRRQRREHEAATMTPTTTSPENDHQWERVAPVLDEALAALPNKDRDAVLLRFIGKKQFSEVGAEMGVSEDAAKKRVSRALARLREFFLRRGTTLTVAALAVLLGERAVQASPTTLATKIAASIGAGASAAAASSATALLKATVHDLFWTRVKWGAAITAGVVAVLFLATTVMRPARNAATTIVSSARTAQEPPAVTPKLVTTDQLNTTEKVAQHTLSLSVLRAEDRQPAAGARILAECAAPRIERVMEGTTDRNGTVNIPIPAKSFSGFRVWVSAEGRVPMLLQWQVNEFTEPVLSHTVLLDPGTTASGTVLDESGNPIAGVKVSFYGGGKYDTTQRENQQFDPKLSAQFTDANGRWTTTQLPSTDPHKLHVSIEVRSPDYVAADTWLGGAPGFPTNTIVVLSNGVALTGRVTTTNGTAVEHAHVSGSNASAQTDANGYFYLPHVNPGRVFLDVEASGFETIHDFVWATNSANQCAFTLKPSSNSIPFAEIFDGSRIRLHGTVVDADTGQPIPSFRVLIGDSGYTPSVLKGDVVFAGGRLLGEGRDGQFDWQALPRIMNFRLALEADGYLEAVSEERGNGNAAEAFAFKLQRAVILTGRVVTPAGSPAENADVTFTGGNMGAVMQKPGQLIDANLGYETARTRSDQEGRFRLKLKRGARGLAVIHASGSALLTLADATNTPIVLQPWGAIDGTLYMNGKPAPNQTISINGAQRLETDSRVIFSFSYTSSTDERGHFRFDQVLPGEVSVARWVGISDTGMSVINSDQATNVLVKSGAVSTVELRRQGRPVIGRLVYQGSSNDIYWGTSQAALEGANRFPFALSRDGTIRAEDVPPGNYTLVVELTGATANPQIFDKAFGELREEVVVPPAKDETVPVDLGELTVPRAK